MVLCFEDGIKKYKKQGTTWYYTGDADKFSSCVGFSEVKDWHVQNMKRRARAVRLLIKYKQKLLQALANYLNKTGNETLANNPGMREKMINMGAYDPYQYEMDFTAGVIAINLRRTPCRTLKLLLPMLPTNKAALMYTFAATFEKCM
ncbi:MAG TPA: hypothetical protein VD905_11805 [Flavobacteriales bacterium]|nr:hypothetical protein [Flavobacteriales bacterium]